MPLLFAKKVYNKKKNCSQNSQTKNDKQHNRQLSYSRNGGGGEKINGWKTRSSKRGGRGPSMVLKHRKKHSFFTNARAGGMQSPKLGEKGGVTIRSL